MYALAGFVAGLAYALVGRWAETPLSERSALLLLRRPTVPTDTVAPLLLPFAVAAVVHLLVNYGMIRQRLRLDWRRQQADPQTGTGMGTVPLLASDLGLSAFGLVIAALWSAVGFFAVGIVLVPLGVAQWAISQFTEQQDARMAALATLNKAVGIKDLYTRRHGERVSRSAGLIARQIGLGTARLEAVMVAGLLHDVGKLAVPTRVLQKDEPLTEEEAAAIQLHPTAGLTMVGGIQFLGEALSGIMHHHERMDGSGYPTGLAGDEIPEFARIIAVADAFDSMTSDRAYRKSLDTSEAASELRRCAGSQFDPVMVEALIAALSRDEWAGDMG